MPTTSYVELGNEIGVILEENKVLTAKVKTLERQAARTPTTEAWVASINEHISSASTKEGIYVRLSSSNLLAVNLGRNPANDRKPILMAHVYPNSRVHVKSEIDKLVAEAVRVERESIGELVAEAVRVERETIDMLVADAVRVERESIAKLVGELVNILSQK